MVGGYKKTRATVSKTAKKSYKRFRRSTKKGTRLTKGQYKTVNKMINKKIYNPKYVEYQTYNYNFLSSEGGYINGSAINLTPDNWKKDAGTGQYVDKTNKRFLVKSIQIKGWVSIKQKTRNPDYSRAFMNLCTYISKKGTGSGITDFYTKAPTNLETDANAMQLYYKGVRDKFSYKEYKFIKGLNMRRSIKEVSSSGSGAYEISENMFKVNLYKRLNIPVYIGKDERTALDEVQNEILIYIFKSNPESYEYAWDLDISIKYLDV